MKNTGGTFIRFGPEKGTKGLPLGWSLSDSARKKLDEQAKEAIEASWPPKYKVTR